MRVAYLVSRFPEYSQTFILREIDALRARGMDVEVFAIRTPPASHLRDQQFREIADQTRYVLGVGWIRILLAQCHAAIAHPFAYISTALRALSLGVLSPRSLAWQAFYFVEAIVLAQLVRSTGRRHIHVHFANAGSDVAMLATMYGQRAGGDWPSTWSFTMHGPTEFSDVTHYKLGTKVANARFVCCISHYCKSQLMACSRPEDWDKLVLARCTVPTTRRSATVDRVSAASPQVLAVGRIVPEKGFFLLLEAVRILRRGGVQCDVTFVGDGPLRKTLEEAIGVECLTGGVRCVGAISHNEVLELMDQADMFCLPSFAEGLPIVLMEAIVSRTPIVSTNVAGIPEMLTDGRSALLVPPGDERALACAILETLADPDGARLRAAEAYSDYERIFARHRSEDQLISRFRQLQL
jgi:colanic acid/amylovoran biosynthesis glycosyltransferase